MTDKQQRMRETWSDPVLSARAMSAIKSALQDVYDRPPNPTLSDLFDVWDTHNRDVERWASGIYRDERRAEDWVDLGGEAG